MIDGYSFRGAIKRGAAWVLAPLSLGISTAIAEVCIESAAILATVPE
jgi:hypothetical protein